MSPMPSLLIAVSVLLGADPETPPAPAPPPLLYELSINGETFTIEADQAVTLTSQEHEGVTYQVALRVAQVQRLPLNTVQLDYDRGFAVEDDQGAQVRTARLRHELGFRITLADMGGALTPEGNQKLLEALAANLQDQFREQKASEITASKPRKTKLGQADATTVKITYQDNEKIGHTCFVQVLAGEDFCCSAIIEMLDSDKEDALPLVERTLETLRKREK